MAAHTEEKQKIIQKNLEKEKMGWEHKERGERKEGRLRRCLEQRED